jgi:hypothetical protein
MTKLHRLDIAYTYRHFLLFYKPEETIFSDYLQRRLNCRCWIVEKQKQMRTRSNWHVAFKKKLYFYVTILSNHSVTPPTRKTVSKIDSKTGFDRKVQTYTYSWVVARGSEVRIRVPPNR